MTVCVCFTCARVCPYYVRVHTYYVHVCMIDSVDCGGLLLLYVATAGPIWLKLGLEIVPTRINTQYFLTRKNPLFPRDWQKKTKLHTGENAGKKLAFYKVNKSLANII